MGRNQRVSEEIEEAVRVGLYEQHIPQTTLAKNLGIHRTTIPNIMVRHPEWPPLDLDRREINRSPDQADKDRERARAKEDIAELRRLTSLRNFQQDLRESLLTAAYAIEPPELHPEALSTPPFDEETAVLHLSDVHIGQNTSSRINAGWEYNVGVAISQFRQLTHSLKRIWEIQRLSTPWRNLVIIDTGDDVEGSDMRASQHRIVDPLVTKQVVLYGKLLATLVLQSLTLFHKVRVERVPGNHGRTSQKAGNAGLSELDPGDSYDWLAGEYAAALLRDAIAKNRVEFVNHETFYGKTEIMGHTILFEHGAALRGGGFGGLPYYSIDKVFPAYRDLEGEFSLLLIGHYHRPYILPAGYGSWLVGDGSFTPTTPYVVASKHRATRPAQSLLSIHPKRGLTMSRWLYLDTVRKASRLDKNTWGKMIEKDFSDATDL